MPLARPLTFLGMCLRPQVPPDAGFQPTPGASAVPGCPCQLPCTQSPGSSCSPVLWCLTTLCRVAWGRQILGCSCPAGEATHPPGKEAKASSPCGGLRVRAPRGTLVVTLQDFRGRTVGTESECCARGQHFSSRGSARDGAPRSYGCVRAPCSCLRRSPPLQTAFQNALVFFLAKTKSPMEGSSASALSREATC